MQKRLPVFGGAWALWLLEKSGNRGSLSECGPRFGGLFPSGTSIAECLSQDKTNRNVNQSKI